MRETVAWKEQIDLLAQASTATQKLEKLSLEQFQAGLAPLTDVMDAKKQFARTRRLEVDALRQYALSWAKVQVTTGRGWQTLGPVIGADATISRADPLGIEPPTSPDKTSQ